MAPQVQPLQCPSPLASSPGDGACPTLIQARLGPLLCGRPAAYPPHRGGHWVGPRSLCVRRAHSPSRLQSWCPPPTVRVALELTPQPPASARLHPAARQAPVAGEGGSGRVEGQRGQRGRLICLGGGKELLPFGYVSSRWQQRPPFGCSPEESGAFHTVVCPSGGQRPSPLWKSALPPSPFSQVPSPNLPLCILGPGWVVSSPMIGRVLRSLQGLQGEALRKSS